MDFTLPDEVRALLAARNKLRDHYGQAGLRFTLDGNLVGDIGEAIAAEIFGLKLTPRCGPGIDGHAPDGRSVQVKASGTQRGPAFRCLENRADHLLFFNLDFERCVGRVTFNGPEHIALNFLPDLWQGQRSLTHQQIRKADTLVTYETRLLPTQSWVAIPKRA